MNAKEYIDGIVLRMREAWKDHDLVIKAQGAMIDDLRKKISGFETLMVDIRGKEAVDLHTSFPADDDIPIIN